MAASVAVHHRFFIFSERIERVVEHAIHPFCVRTCSYRPAHHFAIKTVDYGRQIDLARRQVELKLGYLQYQSATSHLGCRIENFWQGDFQVPALFLRSKSCIVVAWLA